MDVEKLAGWLKARMVSNLPGKGAQLKMASMVRLNELSRYIQPKNPKPSGVLILLYPKSSEVSLILIKRPEYNGVHSGQISLPGGKHEMHDIDIIHTALREASEEIGLDTRNVSVIGKLTDLYIPPSNFLVTPVVGYSEDTPIFIPDAQEVASLIEVTLPELLEDRNILPVKVKLNFGITLKVPAFCIQGATIWGATAMILSEFRELLKEYGDVKR